MKKILVVTAASVLGFGLVNAADVTSKKTTPKLATKDAILKIVSIDSISIMQNSKEGLKVTQEIQKKVDALQDYIKKAQEELVLMQDEISKKKDLLSQDALQEKSNELIAKKKKTEIEIASRQSTLRTEIQRKQLKLRDKQMALTEKFFKDNNWGLMIDKNTPGVLCVSNAIDKTKDVLALVDADYEKSLKAESVSAKASSDRTTKTAQTKKAAVKREIKRA